MWWKLPLMSWRLDKRRVIRVIILFLMGRLSPLDGIGPEEIGIQQFIQRLTVNPPREVILATNPTVEGEATAHYLAECANHYGIQVSRIAHGVPMGSELEFIDGNTLSRSLNARVLIEQE